MKKLVLFLLFFLQIAALGIAQNNASNDRDELEKKKKRLLEEIENAEDLLQKTRHNKNASVTEVLALKQKISARQKLIANYNSQLNNIQSNIVSTQKTIHAMDVRLDSLKAEYARLIVKAYKTHGELDKMLFVFSAKDFNDAYQRVKYLQQYSDYRQMQGRLIKETKDQRLHKLSELKGQKDEKVTLLGTEQQQKKTLESEKIQKDKVLNSLKGQESQLIGQIKEKKKSAAKLNKLIEDIIRKEIDAARRKAEPGSSKVLALTPEAKALSENFAGNKGQLPWPVERGMIVSHFGKHEHEILERVQVNNNGVDIKTQPGANVRTVFEGTVKAVLFNPAFQKAVLINHGEYFSVYSNLDEVTVKIGDKVTTKQIIGKVYTNTDEDKTEVHLEIWKNTDKLNPESWLYGQ
jgi:murein hydrolase activator